MDIYVASPLGFSEIGRTFYYSSLIPAIEGLGHIVLDPWQLTNAEKIIKVQRLAYGPGKRRAWQVLNREIAANNTAAIDKCSAVFAVLDGVDVDSGTAAEIGYAFGRGKRISGYRGDLRLSSDNPGAVVNLQIEYFIRASGGLIISRLRELGRCLNRCEKPTAP